MGATTNIAWTDASWNPVTGCTKVSAGCSHCYADAMAGREIGDFRRVTRRIGDIDVVEHRDFGEVRCHPDRLTIPLQWRKPRRVFVCSMSDLFHDAVPAEFIRRVFQQMRNAKQHTYQILTKRPERMRDFVTEFYAEKAYVGCDTGEPIPIQAPPHIWLGVSCEDQATANARIPLLLQTPAAVRFVSVEPMLGPVNLTKISTKWGPGSMCVGTVLNPDPRLFSPVPGVGLDWVILGGESGPQARPLHPEWARSVRDQCQLAGVPFFFKQWGEFQECKKRGEKYAIDPRKQSYVLYKDGTGHEYKSNWDGQTIAVVMERVGTKAAGHLLDGKEYRAFPC